MTTITTRTNKDSELTFAEGDANLDRDVITAAADPAQIDGSDNRSTYECTGTFNFTLPQASLIVAPAIATPWNDYEVTIKNVGSGVITVRTSSTDTLDGVAAPGDKAISAGNGITYKVNSGTNGYFSTSITEPVLNIVNDTTPQLGGDLDCQGNFVGFTQQTISYSVSTTTVNWGSGNKAAMDFGAGNIGTMAFTDPANPSNMVLKLTQDGTGSRVITAWDADILWTDGVVPTLSTGADAVDIISFYWDGTNYFGAYGLNYS